MSVRKRKGMANHPCKGCVDAAQVGGYVICDYAAHTGRLRSAICPPGAACTVKSTVPRKAGYMEGIEARRAPMRRSRRTAWSQDKALALWRKGMTDREIAGQLGVQRHVINCWRRRNGLARREKVSA